MDVTIQRTDSQRSQNGNGPRVSFNRDVHVKRIGSRQSPAESHHQETPPRVATPPVRRELPQDLSEEGILAEAARVLAQAESVKCTAQGGNDIVGGRINSKSRGPIEPLRKFPESQFNSLPLRGKKKIKTPVTRSVSDASAKKSKKPSIFSLFGGRRDSGPEEGTGKRVTRSKSDVGTSRERNTVRKRNNSEDDEGVNAKKKVPPLSPIIESSQREDYFAKGHEARESKSPRGPVKLDDLNVQPVKGVSDNIKDTISNLVTTQAKSTEEMHSSQQPAERPPLTKGLTVDGMVKRLSMERFSPPPQIAGPAFSYTRPKEQIIYAQVVCDGDKAKQTVHYAPSHLNGFHTETNGRRNGRPSHSPSPFRDLNGERLTRKETPRVNSDEDEGLGFEIKRPYEEDFRTLVDEGPITPNIRDVPPEKYYLGGDLLASGGRKPAFQDLSQRREILQSRINNRRFGSREILEDTSPERENLFARTQESRYQRSKSHDIDQVDNAKKYHKFGSQEVMNRYSPERSHLDMTQTPSNGRITSKYVEESRYFRDGYRETYRRETNIGADGKPKTSESTSRERLASPRRTPKEIDLGYIEDHRDFNVGHIEPNTSYFQEKYRSDLQQPRSLESTTSGDGEGFRHHLKSAHLTNGYRHDSMEKYQNSLKRQQKHQRSFDKGDSGIENDYRKDSFNGDLQTRWRRRTVDDDIKTCELFLRKERRHTEDNHPTKRRFHYAYRERSIDDGSHFDPRLDKYPEGGTLRRGKSPVKVEKKKSGLEKVKQLLTGSGKKKSAKEEKTKEKYMVKEEEMRARYSEYRGPNEGPKIHDISTRRRLSTPKASPIPRRTSSQKSTSKSSSNLSQQENAPVQKLSWFKSLDRLSRKNKTPPSRKTPSDDDFSSIRSPRPRPLSPRQENQAPLRKNLRFFGDTDQESNASVSKGNWKNKSRHPLSSALNRGQKKYSRSAYDLDTISKGTKITSASKAKSSSLQHLEDDFLFNGRSKTQSRNLHDISESASDNENSPTGRHQSRSAPAKPQRGRQSAESTSIIKSTTLNRRTPNGVTVSSSHDEEVENELPFQRKRHYFEEASRRHESPARSQTLRRELSFGGSGSNDYRKPPPGPQKPARLFEKRRAFSRERERLHDSSGTEGDSSQQSQRSVVYLHATTVGDIPQPMMLNRRRAASREELSSKSKGQRPMTRTVSRSVSVLAPWKPKHLHEGYEINYSQSQDKPRKFYERKSPGTSSNLTPKRDTTTLTRYKKSTPRDEMSSDKSSSFKSSSNLGFTAQQRQTRSHKRESEPRNLSEISLTRRRDTPERLPATRRRWND